MSGSRRDFLGLLSGVAATTLASQSTTARAETSEVPAQTPRGYRIHPAIGVARVGDSGSNLSDPFAHPDTFYVGPESIGGLPTEFEKDANGEAVPVTSFKDRASQVRRQAARFRIYRDDGEGGSEVVRLDDPEIAEIRWTVHVANKKPAWYDFSEFRGNLMMGAENSYEATGAARRNAAISETQRRRNMLIIDPGPRSVDQPGITAAFDSQIEPDPRTGETYAHVSFPGSDGIGAELGYGTGRLYPYSIDTLGHMKMEDDGGLLVLGGYGRAGGPKAQGIESFAGADGFFDDISDGSVHAEITLASGETFTLEAWVLTGPPKVAPELVNITTLDDIIFDMAVRYKAAAPEIFDATTNTWKTEFVVDYDRHIRPIFERMRSYQWTVDVAPMIGFATPRFDTSDMSEANRAARERWFSYLRDPGSDRDWELSPSHQDLFSDDGFPMMPLNSGSNSVTNHDISKFLSLTPTQYFFFRQWSDGKFERGGPRRSRFAPHPIDCASVGNCVGAPMSPGIEVSWSLRNPALFPDDDPYRLSVYDPVAIRQEGLDPDRDETRGGGCQPGDLTKRMAIPWQADFFLCGAQPVNFTDPLLNKLSEGSQVEHLPAPPTFTAVWWPPQRPLFVYSGAESAETQSMDGDISMGERAAYARGINTFLQAILGWRYLGFVTNLNTGEDRDDYPFFVETERNFAKFRAVKLEFSEDGTLRTDAQTETVLERNLSRHATPFHYYVGRK
ncbi:MAG: CTQ-dependent lysine 6-oxidase LodA [Pseudomonadota bacterium]